MIWTAHKIKHELKKKAIRVAIFESTKSSDDYKEFILLEDALKIIDDVLTDKSTKQDRNNRGQDIPA